MDGINIQTQNFNAENLQNPEKPKNNKGLIITVIVLVVALAFGAAYYFFVMNKEAVTVVEQVSSPQTLPQVVGPQTPPPGPSDELNDISSDLNAIDLNALENDTTSDTVNINASLQ